MEPTRQYEPIEPGHAPEPELQERIELPGRAIPAATDDVLSAVLPEAGLFVP
jgi:hypothetical protein